MKKVVVFFICTVLLSTIVLPVTVESTVFDRFNTSFEKCNQTTIHNLGDTELRWLVVGDLKRCIRSYRIHIPPGYDGSKPVPLVLVLHGYTSNSEVMERVIGFNEKADEEGFIVVYPNGATDLLLFLGYRVLHPSHRWARFWNVGFFWRNAGLFFDTALSRDMDDVGFIQELIGHLQDELYVNSSRVYIAGVSNGGMMSYRLGSELSDTVAAIAPVAGTSGGRYRKKSDLYVVPEPEHPVSVVAFHGLQDRVVPYEGDMHYLSVNESISYWVEYNDCNPVPDVNKSESGNVIVRTYSNGSDNSEVKLYTIVNGAHDWFGSKNSDISEVSTTDLMWEFFELHPKKQVE